MEAVSGSKSLSGCSCWSQIQREITAEFRSTSARVSVPVCSRRWCRKESQRSAAYFSCSSTLKPETNPRQDLQTSKKDLKLDSETRCSEEEEWCEFLFLLQLQNKMKQTKKKNLTNIKSDPTSSRPVGDIKLYSQQNIHKITEGGKWRSRTDGEAKLSSKNYLIIWLLVSS